MKKLIALTTLLACYSLNAQDSTDINYGSTFDGATFDGLFFADSTGARYDSRANVGLLAVGLFGDLGSNSTFSEYLADFTSFGFSNSGSVSSPGYWQGSSNVVGNYSASTPYVVVLGGIDDYANASSATSISIYTDTGWSIAAPASPTASATNLLTLQPDTIVLGSLNAVSDGYEMVGVATSAVPEPSTYAALLGALALGFVVYRRRRS
jgi:hypothetical protein